MFDTFRQIDAGALNVGYVDVGPATGPVVILLHGWPYNIHSFLEVAPLLMAKGFRVIIPHLRGYGTTRFQSNDAIRNSQQAVRGVLETCAVSRIRAGLHSGRGNNSPEEVCVGVDQWVVGWFINGKPVDEAQQETCFACHEARVKGHDFVFTRYAP